MFKIFMLLLCLGSEYYGTFDFLFVDADKDNYVNYHKRLIDVVNIGRL
ncbi:hypothetical protein DCAR_0312960 [Daucus carota subsp. sativus]|uniref:Uncharacterized protein n=1 Tax=Daucus carota subsp. sativus TaxID=79200 RepID=A0AAF1ASE4_DAUCS|nr:hypothetical protein DCAR_0312960 [Daucus carota subsp. sativus]